MRQIDRYNNVPYKNNSNKLTSAMMDELCELYIKGWKVAKLAKKYELHYSSVSYYIKKYKLKQSYYIKKYKLQQSRKKIMLTKKKVILPIKKKIQQRSDHYMKSMLKIKNDNMPHNIPRTYNEIRQDTLKREKTSLYDTECSHKYWIKRCSMCHAILESDSKINDVPNNIKKDVYNQFERIVCSWSLAKMLAKMKVKQESLLYWVYHTKLKILQIKHKQNLPDRHDLDTLVASAFTTQELCKKILKTKLNNTSLIQFAKISNKPNELASLLIKSLKK